METSAVLTMVVSTFLLPPHCTASPLRSFAYARSSCKKVYACEGEKAVGKSVWQGRARVYGSRELAVQV